jgi:hypothetical protein
MNIEFNEADHFAAFSILRDWMILQDKSRPTATKKDDYHLVLIELKDASGKSIPNDREYSHLYFGDKKLSDEVFRKGGLGGTFCDGYCELIHYTKDPKTGQYENSAWVIVDSQGQIKLRSDSYRHIYHIGGRLAVDDRWIYDIETGKILLPKCNGHINGKDFYIAEHRYTFDYIKEKVDVEPGVYRIEKATARMEKIDDIK